MQRGTVVGTIGIMFMGIVAVAVIYQLGQKGNPVANDVTTLGNSTLTNLFK